MDINATLIGQLITFILLVWFTMKYVWPPITQAMHEREKKIASGLEAADRSKHELELAEKKASAILREVKQEANGILDQAHKRSIQLIEEAKEQARLEGKKIIERASDDINRQITEAKEALRKQLANLAVLGAEKIIQRNLDVSTHTKLLDEFAAEI